MNVNSSVIYVYGFIGALVPEIVRLYKVRTDRPTIRCWSFYIIISIVFGLLGGLVAVILPTITPWGAFYAGVALPVIISGILGKPPEEPPREPPRQLRERPPKKYREPPARFSAISLVISLRKLNILRDYLGRLFY